MGFGKYGVSLFSTLLLLLAGCATSPDRIVMTEYPGYLTMTVKRFHDENNQEFMLFQFNLVNTSRGERVICRPRIATTADSVWTVKLQEKQRKGDDALICSSAYFGDVKIDAPGVIIMGKGEFTGDSAAAVRFLLVCDDPDSNSCFVGERELKEVKLDEEVRIDLAAQ